MASDISELSSREERFGEVVFAFLRAREQGETPDPADWLARHSDFATELADFFTDQQAVDGVAAPLREVAQVASGASTDDPDATEAGGATRAGAALASFGDYEVLGELARGGMGTVYKARQRSLNRLVALKVVGAGELATPEDAQRFRMEAQTVALLDDPHIIPVYEVGEHEGRLFFSMKLVEGGSLAGQLDRFKDDPRGAARLMVTVARAVHHAHQRGVLHRDLKPSNILLDRRAGGVSPSVPYVTDFGLAKRVETDSGLTQSGALVGTPSYMAPEQATGRNGLTTTVTDVYGLGAVLYALLTERPPFRGHTVLDTLEQVKGRDPESPRRHNGLVDPDLEAICLRCLEKDPGRRYDSAEALALDLERWLTGEPIQARRASLLRHAATWIRRHRAAVAGAAGLLLALAAFAAAGGWLLGERTARRREADDRVHEALRAAEPGLHAGNPWAPELIAAVQRAEAQLGSPGASEAAADQVELLRKDVRMLAELEGIRLDRTAVRDDHFDDGGSDGRYGLAFRSYGIDVQALDAEDAATLVRASAIGVHLIAGLEDWANGQAALGHEVARAKARRLLAVARQADPDPWRNQLRETLLSRRMGELDRLVRWARVEDLPAPTLGLLGEVVQAQARPTGSSVDLLRRAQQRFPSDFWINHHLAYTLSKLQPPPLEEVVGFYRVTVGLQPLSPGAHLNLASLLKVQGRLDPAIAEYREATRLKPDYYMAHRDLGVALQAAGRVGEAIREYQAALRVRDNDPRLHYNLAATLDDDGRTEEAVAEYERAVRLREDDPDVHHNLAVALKKQSRLDEAVSHFRRSIRLKDDADTRRSLGNTLRMLGRLDDALAEFKAALRLKNDAALTYNDFGNALLENGQLDEAIAAYRQAIRLDKRYPGAHSNLGAALAKKGRLADAVAAYEAALRLAPKSAVVHNKLGNALKDLHRLDDAVREYQQAVRLNPNDAQAHNGLGTVFHLRRKFDAAVVELREAVRLDPRLPAAHYNLARALRAQGGTSEAIDQFRQAIRLDPKLSAPHAELADTLLGEKDLDGAIREYRRAIDLDPKNADVHVNFGVALLYKGRLSEAVIAFREALRINPKDGDTHRNLAVALVKLGRRDDAIAELRAAVRLDPTDVQTHAGLGQLLVMQGRLSEAGQVITTCERLAASRPDQPGVPQQLSVCHLLLGEALAKAHPTEAGREFRRALRFNPDNAQALNDLGWQLAMCAEPSSRDPAEAVRLLRRAVALEPGKGDYWSSLGTAYYRTGDCKAALDALTRAVPLRGGGDSYDFFLLAMAHEQLGHAGEARRWYDRAVRWMEKNRPRDEELLRIRAEAVRLLDAGRRPAQAREEARPQRQQR